MNDTTALPLLLFSFLGSSVIAAIGTVVLAMRTRDNGPLGRFIVLAAGVVIGVAAQVFNYGAIIRMWQTGLDIFVGVAPFVFGLGAVFLTWIVYLEVKGSNIGKK